MKFAAGVLAGGVLHDLATARALCSGWAPYYVNLRVVYLMRRGGEIKAAIATSAVELLTQLDWAQANPDYDKDAKL
ncbi:hypothetical protein SMA75_20145 [Escherichia coli]|uniref:hypothetical protein n=1 Tax=Escherichia coli TaxID=562 RepID=UPI003079588F